MTSYTLPPDKLAKALVLYHAGLWSYFGGTLWNIAILYLLLRLGAGAAIRDLAARVTARRWLQGLIVAPIWLFIVTAINLPISLALHHLNLRYGISVEPWPMWWLDFAKSLGLTLVVGTAVLGFLYLLIRRAPRRWWLWFWILALPVELAAVFIVPVVIDPLFNHFSPLAQADPALVQQLEKVAARGHLHIPPSRMFVMNASARVTGPNAYVTGFGASKRIVVWDTTLRELPTPQILAVYAHEQGHYVLHHIQKGMLYSALVTFVFFWIAFWLFRWIVRRHGPALHITSLDDWSSLGALLLIVTLLGFFADPVSNAFSRHIEHQADVYGEEAIHGLVPNPQATMAASFQHLGELWLEVPHPAPFVVFWTYSHPPTAYRMRFAAHYDPWAPGHHPRYFSSGPG
ncbi:MAG TPA: M48 family metallopeptidase [Acidobacteriaceae bacterium]|nr:M48 family metallopeptidase [Acidobacteriaceae bacterium]